MEELYQLIKDYIQDTINVVPSEYTFDALYADIRVFIKDAIDPNTLADVTEEALQQEVKKFLVMVLNEQLEGVNVADWDNSDLTNQKVNTLLQLSILKATDTLNTGPSTSNCCDNLAFSGLVREGYGSPIVNNTPGRQGDKYSDLVTGTWYIHNGSQYVLLNESSSEIYNNVTASLDLRLAQFQDSFDNLGNYTEFVFKNSSGSVTAPIGGQFVSGVFVPPDTWSDDPVTPLEGQTTYMSKSVWRKNTTTLSWENVTGWSTPINFSAIDGVDGVDGIDGVSGNYVEFIYKESEFRPTTPIGGSFNGTSFVNIPLGWLDNPPVATLPIYMSKGSWKNYGTASNPNWGQVGGWSLPVKITGDAGSSVIIDQSGQVTNITNALNSYINATDAALVDINNTRVFVPSPVGNSYEIGIGLFNSGTASTSGIVFKADNFLIQSSTDATVNPFKVLGGSVYIDNALIGALSADQITSGTLSASMISATDLSSISANLGTVTSGKLQSSSATDTYIDLNAAGASKFISKGSSFSVTADGNVYMNNAIIAEDVVVNGGLSSLVSRYIAGNEWTLGASINSANVYVVPGGMVTSSKYTFDVLPGKNYTITTNYAEWRYNLDWGYWVASMNGSPTNSAMLFCCYVQGLVEGDMQLSTSLVRFSDIQAYFSDTVGVPDTAIQLPTSHRYPTAYSSKVVNGTAIGASLTIQWKLIFGNYTTLASRHKQWHWDSSYLLPSSLDTPAMFKVYSGRTPSTSPSYNGVLRYWDFAGVDHRVTVNRVA